MAKGTTRGNSRAKAGRKTKTLKPPEDAQAGEREAILDERESLRRLFPASYSPDIGVFNENTVEVMFKLTRSQAANLARLLKEHKL